MRRRAKHCFVLFVLLLNLLSPLVVTGQTQGTRSRVLVLLSYDQKNPWTVALLEGLEEGLATAEREPELHIEYMDSKRYSPEVLFPLLEELYRTNHHLETGRRIPSSHWKNDQYRRSCRRGGP